MAGFKRPAMTSNLSRLCPDFGEQRKVACWCWEVCGWLK